MEVDIELLKQVYEEFLSADRDNEVDSSVLVWKRPASLRALFATIGAADSGWAAEHAWLWTAPQPGH